MDLYIKAFQDLTVDELFEILRLRIAVFVVEQRCPYQEADDIDKKALHVYFTEEGKIAAYLRVFPDPAEPAAARIGRVIAVKRRRGLGTKILQAGMDAAKTKLGASKIIVEAQTYTRGLYEKQGFVQTSEEFLEDGIPHIRMETKLGDR